MAIQLDKILENIAKEKALHPSNSSASKKEIDEAWARVGKNNKLSVHESRSIFKVLQKKYEQERVKEHSAWKLFGVMQQIYQPEPKPVIKEEDEQMQMDDVEEYEMLEVQETEEDDEQPSAQLTHSAADNSTGSASDNESPTKSANSSSGGGTPEKEEKIYVRNALIGTPRPPVEEKKLLNSLAHTTTTRNQQQTATTSGAATAAALQKKGITVKKTQSNATSKSGNNTSGIQNSSTQNKQSQRIQLTESLKRKLSDDLAQTNQSSTSQQSKKTHLIEKYSPKNQNSTISNPVVHTTTAQLLQVKKEQRDATQTPPPGINIITIPANATRVELANGGGGGIGGATSSTGATVASTSTNGFSPRIEDIDFKNDIIFDTGATINGTTVATKMNTHHGNEIINLGNFDNSLPPTFFKNLCNSTRHEALGLYVSNVMNRLSNRAAAKLEISILRAILDVQSDELEE